MVLSLPSQGAAEDWALVSLKDVPDPTTPQAGFQSWPESAAPKGFVTILISEPRTGTVIQAGLRTGTVSWVFICIYVLPSARSDEPHAAPGSAGWSTAAWRLRARGGARAGGSSRENTGCEVCHPTRSSISSSTHWSAGARCPQRGRCRAGGQPGSQMLLLRGFLTPPEPWGHWA